MLLHEPLDQTLVDASIHIYPVALTACCFAFACLCVFLTDPYAMPKSVRLPYLLERSRVRLLIEYIARIPIILFVFLLFFAISWVPIYACQATVSFFVIFTAISRAKFIFIREPMVFSDFAMIADLFKYKKIFYANAWIMLLWVVAAAYIFGVSAAYMILAPSVLPDSHRALLILAGILLPLSPIALMFVTPLGNVASVFARKMILKTLHARSITARFGTFSSVAYHFIVWFGMKRELLAAEITRALQQVWQEMTGDQHVDMPLILVWQSESFLDLRHFGDRKLKLPTIDRLKKRSVKWGRMTSVFEGGYTLRTEFAVLSGLQPHDVDADASYPYLMAHHYADVVWPAKLKKAGWLTHFIHPYDRTFFVRHKAMPVLGFDAMTMLDAFDHDPQKQGPYVSDMALTRKVLNITRTIDATQPALLFVASMANHGPWEPEPGRCPDMSDPIDIYRELMKRADLALETLIAELDQLDRPVWLAFYGDHAPLLKTFADPFPDPRTDYFIVPLGTAARDKHRPVPATSVEPWNLFEAVLRHARLPAADPKTTT